MKPNVSEHVSTSRIEHILGRSLTENEKKIYVLREGGYRGPVDWDTGEALSEEQVQKRVDDWIDSQEAQGLEYTTEHGWVPKESER